MDLTVAVPSAPPTTLPLAIPSITIFLFEGKKFPVGGEETGAGDPFCEFLLGKERYRSCTASGTDLDETNPRWMEEFDLYQKDPRYSQLDVTVWDTRLAGTKTVVIGKASLALNNLEHGKLEELWLDVKDGQEITGTLRLSFTLGKRWLSINAVRDEKLLAQQRHFYEKFHLRNTLRLTADDDVGVVVVKIIRAENISHSTATNRNTGIFCSVQLTNSRLDTFISESSADPEWNCVFTFPVKDVHTELLLSLWRHSGSDPAGKAVFYGGTALRLTEIVNKQPCWLPLKDKELQADVPGLLLLEMEAIYNPVRAAVKSIARKESYPSRKEAKISLKTFSYDVQRARNVAAQFSAMGRVLRRILSWESPIITILSFLFYILFVSYVQIWMIPFCLLICVLANARVKHNGKSLSNMVNRQIDDLGEKPDDQPDPPSLFTRVFVDIPDAALHVQNVLRFAMDLHEQLLNIVQFNERWLATCLSIALAGATLLTYFLPLRLLLILFGIHKFTKKLRNPNSIPHNEVVAFVSRARSNDELRMYAELESPSVLLESVSSHGGSGDSSNTATGSASAGGHHRHPDASRNLIGVGKLPKF